MNIFFVFIIDFRLYDNKQSYENQPSKKKLYKAQRHIYIKNDYF